MFKYKTTRRRAGAAHRVIWKTSSKQNFIYNSPDNALMLQYRFQLGLAFTPRVLESMRKASRLLFGIKGLVKDTKMAIL